jgi:hypothetical protein
MIEHPLSFQLPTPWASDERFQIERFGELSFLVGPNGSGKSRFAETLKGHLPDARILGTNRLDGMGLNPMGFVYGDHLAAGYQKSNFQHFRTAGTNHGSGLDTFMILEERPDIRIVVEATLSSLFNRDISLEWDSGNLIPKARSSKGGDSYRIDRDECHGIRELLVLLTHLHYDKHQYLIIDEPELNLHPQFQSFFLQEVRKIAGQPQQGTSKKGIFLITHSPFIIDLRTVDDLRSVFSFSADHSLPKFIGQVTAEEKGRLASLVPRLNVHHKQLFFSDNPIFVEGISDAQFVETIQQRRGVSITAAGSCIIDAGGCEEVTKYLEFCQHFNKKAYFLYDLDSLFSGNLRKCIRADGQISEFLAALGLGSNFGSYVGALEKKLTDAAKKISEAVGLHGVSAELQAHVLSLENHQDKWPRIRVAILTDVAAHRGELVNVLEERLVTEIEGRLKQVVSALETRNIFLLGGGALENYLPSYSGNRYEMAEDAKKVAVNQEVDLLATGGFDNALPERYGKLFETILKLPAKAPVDTEAVLRVYVANYIHEFQTMVLGHPDWAIEQYNAHFDTSSNGLGRLVRLTEFDRLKDKEFKAVLTIVGSQSRTVQVSQATNAGMQQFEFIKVN